jgi:O-methyltransferase
MTELHIPDQRLVTLALAVEYIYNARVEGDVIEFGVKAGYTASMLASTMKAWQGLELDFPRDRKLWLCDSFEGFPEADCDIDRHSPMNEIWKPGSSRGCTAALLREGMEKILPGQIEIVEGWYGDTWQAYATSERSERLYALVHADCDLYGSTMDALDPLFSGDCIAPGCIILFDDWNAAKADPKFGQRRAWSELVEYHGIEASDEGGYAACGHKFIVHGYR